MKTYYIYHIPGIKIGVSTRPEQRVNDQGYTEFEILEEHTDIMVVSMRERELQIKYFGKADNSQLYYKSYNALINSQSKHNSSLGGKANTEKQKQHRKNRGFLLTQDKTHQSNAARASGLLNSIKTSTCPHCNHTGKFLGMIRWHFNNCKYK